MKKKQGILGLVLAMAVAGNVWADTVTFSSGMTDWYTRTNPLVKTTAIYPLEARATWATNGIDTSSGAVNNQLYVWGNAAHSSSTIYPTVGPSGAWAGATWTVPDAAEGFVNVVTSIHVLGNFYNAGTGMRASVYGGTIDGTAGDTNLAVYSGTGARYWYDVTTNFDTGDMISKLQFRAWDISTGQVIASTYTGVITYVQINYTPVEVPEPATMALLGLGGTTVLFRRKK